MKESLFVPLKAENLTTLKIRYDFRTDAFCFFAAREWEMDFDFSQYNKSFILDGIFTTNAEYLNTRQVLALYERYGLMEYIGKIKDLIRKGKHIGITCYFHQKHDIRFMMHEHSRRVGLYNKSHAIMAGGIRRRFLEDEELEVIIDGLNLARGMSFKNLAAHIPFGGCKATVIMEPLDIDNMEVMGFLAFALDSCRDLSGPDMNLPPEMSDVMQERKLSAQYIGGRKAKTGPTGKPTAYGVYLTMKQAVKFKEGTDSLNGKSIALQGLGSVGWPMAEYLLKEDVRLSITARHPEKVDRFIKAHPGRGIQAFAPEEFLNMEVDILCPCAMGGLFTEENIPRLKCKYIWGGANNVLKASSQQEEICLANMLQERDILFQVEWYHNAAGILCCAEEYMFDGTTQTLHKKIEEILPPSTFENLMKAQEIGITPTELASGDAKGLSTHKTVRHNNRSNA